MNWISVDEKKPKICQEVIFTDGDKIFAGWLECSEPLEDDLWYDALSQEWPECITHWMPMPSACCSKHKNIKDKCC